MQLTNLFVVPGEEPEVVTKRLIDLEHLPKLKYLEIVDLGDNLLEVTHRLHCLHLHCLHLLDCLPAPPAMSAPPLLRCLDCLHCLDCLRCLDCLDMLLQCLDTLLFPGCKSYRKTQLTSGACDECCSLTPRCLTHPAIGWHLCLCLCMCPSIPVRPSKYESVFVSLYLCLFIYQCLSVCLSTSVLVMMKSKELKNSISILMLIL